jgi:hypothetical protein
LLLAVMSFALSAIDHGRSLAAGSSDDAKQLPAQSVEALAAAIEHEHALAALELSKRLWEAGRKDDAVFFFYLGQLRYRANLLANAKEAPPDQRALFDALMSAMGPPINQYAFGDIPALVAMIDRVIAWDDNHADDYATRNARDEVKAGLRKLRADVLARQDEIRRTRSEHGLPNRSP